MKVTILAEAKSSYYYSAIFELLKEKRVEAVNFWGPKDFIQKPWLIFKCLSDIFSAECLVLGFAPLNPTIPFFNYLAKREKNMVYFTSWTEWGEPREYKWKFNFLFIKKHWHQFLSRVKTVAVTAEARESLLGFEKRSSITVIPHSLDTSAYYPDKQAKLARKQQLVEGKDTVINYVYIGRFVDVKAITELVELFTKETLKNSHLQLIGYGELEKEVRELAKGHSNIEFLGKITDTEKKRDLLQKADFMLVPSKEEKFGLVVIESLACGTNVIASNTVGPKTILDDLKTGISFDIMDFQKLEKILLNRDLLVDSLILEGSVYNGIKTRYSVTSNSSRWFEVLSKNFYRSQN